MSLSLTECGDVLTNPLHPSPLILRAEVAAASVRRVGGDLLAAEPAEDAQAIVQRDDDHIFGRGDELLGAERAAGAAFVAPAVDEEHHRQALARHVRLERPRCVDVEEEALLRGLAGRAERQRRANLLPRGRGKRRLPALHRGERDALEGAGLRRREALSSGDVLQRALERAGGCADDERVGLLQAAFSACIIQRGQFSAVVAVRAAWFGVRLTLLVGAAAAAETKPPERATAMAAPASRITIEQRVRAASAIEQLYMARRVRQSSAYRTKYGRIDVCNLLQDDMRRSTNTAVFM